MIFIIIPVFNRWHFTKECLLSLQNQTYREFKTIVVDHGSSDGTSEFIQREFPEVILLKGDESMWWTAATNFGVKRALELSTSEDDLILTLNNDLVVKPDYLEKIITLSQELQPAIIGSSSVDINNPDALYFSGIKWNRYTAKYRTIRRINESYSNIKESYTYFESDLLPGRGTLFPISVFREFGLFNEKVFPHYAADEDFSLLCSKNGYKLIVSMDAFVMSHINESGMKIPNNQKSFKYFLGSLREKNSPNNLKKRYSWARKNTPIPILYFMFDFSRIVFSFVKMRFKKAPSR